MISSSDTIFHWLHTIQDNRTEIKLGKMYIEVQIHLCQIRLIQEKVDSILREHNIEVE